MNGIVVSLSDWRRLFSHGQVTLHLAVSGGSSVRPSVQNIYELRAVYAMLLLPNHPRLDCRVSGLVYLVLAPTLPLPHVK